MVFELARAAAGVRDRRTAALLCILPSSIPPSIYCACYL